MPVAFTLFKKGFANYYQKRVFSSLVSPKSILVPPGEYPGIHFMYITQKSVTFSHHLRGKIYRYVKKPDEVLEQNVNERSIKQAVKIIQELKDKASYEIYSEDYSDHAYGSPEEKSKLEKHLDPDILSAVSQHIPSYNFLADTNDLAYLRRKAVFSQFPWIIWRLPRLDFRNPPCFSEKEKNSIKIFFERVDQGKPPVDCLQYYLLDFFNLAFPTILLNKLKYIPGENYDQVVLLANTTDFKFTFSKDTKNVYSIYHPVNHEFRTKYEYFIKFYMPYFSKAPEEFVAMQIIRNEILQNKLSFNDPMVLNLMLHKKSTWQNELEHYKPVLAHPSDATRLRHELSDTINAFIQHILYPWMVPIMLRYPGVDIEVFSTCLKQVTANLLTEYLTITQLLNANIWWHQQQERISQALNIQSAASINTEKLSWPGLSSTIETSTAGIKIVCLSNEEELREDGQIMQHCVASYSTSCYSGEKHLLSLRDNLGKRISTACVRVGSNQQVVISQHFGIKNSAPSAEAIIALNWYLQQINNKSIPVKWNELLQHHQKARYLKFNAKIGFSPSDDKTYAKAFAIYKNHFIRPNSIRSPQHFIQHHKIIERTEDEYIRRDLKSFLAPQ